MQMLYNSDQYTVMRIDYADGSDAQAQPSGGYEIVDKFARTGIFLQGAVARQFEAQAQALAPQGEPQAADVEALDDFIAGYAVLGGQPMALH